MNIYQKIKLQAAIVSAAPDFNNRAKIWKCAICRPLDSEVARIERQYNCTVEYVGEEDIEFCTEHDSHMITHYLYRITGYGDKLEQIVFSLKRADFSLM